MICLSTDVLTEKGISDSIEGRVALFVCLRYIGRVMGKALIFSVCHVGYSKFLGRYRIKLQSPLAFRGSWILISPAKSRFLRII